MANSLNREIRAGEVLVVKRDRVSAEYAAASRRLFIARAGFGMKDFTSGSAVMGDDARLEVGNVLVREGSCRREGYDFDVAETELWQKDHGRFASEYAEPVSVSSGT